MVIRLRYGNTNTFLVRGDKQGILVDTDYAGTLPAFYKAIKEAGITVNDISYILATHYHPDHIGLVSSLMEQGVKLILIDSQTPFVHYSDEIFAKEPHFEYKPIDVSSSVVISPAESRAFLKDLGICGEIICTPSHSDDSISLVLDDGNLFVGDLNPLYELELHRGTRIEESWNKLLSFNPKEIYYGHAKKAVIGDTACETLGSDLYDLVSRIMRMIDKGCDLKKIQKKTGADSTFIQDVMRMYLTHQNVGVQGILDRIEIKGR